MVIGIVSENKMPVKFIGVGEQIDDMEYLSELINAQLENRRPQDIPAQIDIDKLVQIAHENHIDYLILG